MGIGPLFRITVMKLHKENYSDILRNYNKQILPCSKEYRRRYYQWIRMK